MAYQRRRFLEFLALSKPTNPKSLLQVIVLLLAFAAIVSVGITTGIMSPDKHGSIGQALFFVAGSLTSLFIYLIERSMTGRVDAFVQRSDERTDDKSLIDSLFSSTRKPEPASGESGSSRIILFEPRSFDEVARIVSSIDKGAAAIVNLTMMEPGEAQRAVDFIAGGTYGAGGHQERVGESIFFFAPGNMEVCIAGLEQDYSSNSVPNPKFLAEGLGVKVDLTTKAPTVVPANEVWGKAPAEGSEEKVVDSTRESSADLSKEVLGGDGESLQ